MPHTSSQASHTDMREQKIVTMSKLSDNPNNIAHPIHASRADRPVSFHLSDFPVPTGKEEEWRFTPLDRLSDFFASAVSGQEPTVQAERMILEKTTCADPRLGKLSPPDDFLGAFAWEYAQSAYIASLPAHTTLDHEARIMLRGTDSEQVSALQLLLDIGQGSQGTIILSHTGQARLAEGVEVNVADGADIVLVSIQDWDDSSAHAVNFRMRVGRDAHVKHIVVSLGGSVVRVSTSLDYAAPGGEAELLGAYFAHEHQHLEHRLFVDHNQPHTRSHAVYKGALQGESAHSVWVGDVLIRPVAEGINTYELNRNLVLTPGAQADSVPNLEIETGNIEGAGHASATGRFDDDQLFYLRSRGIPEKEARRLVVIGFFAELINHIGVPEVQEKLMNHIDKELGTQV